MKASITCSQTGNIVAIGVAFEIEAEAGPETALLVQAMHEAGTLTRMLKLLQAVVNVGQAKQETESLAKRCHLRLVK